jgi:hypothetical protein
VKKVVTAMDNAHDDKKDRLIREAGIYLYKHIYINIFRYYIFAHIRKDEYN